MIDIKLGDQEILFKDIADNSINAIITDPPYNLTWNHKIETNFNFEIFLNNCFRVLKENGFLIYFCQEPSASEWNYLSLKKFKYISEIIWYKKFIANVFLYPLKVHEKIMIFSKGKGKLNPVKIAWENEKKELLEYLKSESLLKQIFELKKLINKSISFEDLKEKANKTSEIKIKVYNDSIYKKMYGNFSIKEKNILKDKKLTTLWGCPPHNLQKFNKENFNIKHPTVKPLQILQRLIEMATDKNDLILDPFLGSGTTALASKYMSRKFIGFEIDEEYFKISNGRLNDILI